MASSISKSAILSPCGSYRYALYRWWSREYPRVLFVMLNPSTADADTDDATIRSCTRVARWRGFGGITVVNLFAIRSTDPNKIYEFDDPVGPDNDFHLNFEASRHETIVCAWGAHPASRQRSHPVCSMLAMHRRILFCLGVTKSGAPKHPLYVPTSAPLQAFS